MTVMVRSWFNGYFHPTKMIDDLSTQQSPLLGFGATVARGLMTSLLLFLPLFVLGRQPSVPSHLSFVKTENYFLFLTIAAPFFFILQWLYLSGTVYLILRLLRIRCSFDQILNIFGLVSLVVGFVLILWDWPWVIVQSKNYILLGMSHLAIDIWAVVLATVSLKRIVGIRIWLGAVLSIIWILLGLPPAILIMRSPL
jgi:hypothetical protein